MSTDYTALLAPINESSPCGEDLLFSADFDAIAHARRFDDPSLDQGEWVTEIKEADWPFVVERSSALLATQTKDLRVAVWLTEALAIQEGVPGLTQGYAVLTGLIERFWDQVHPLPEGDDVESRLGNVAWLAGRSAELLRAVPLTQSDTAFSTLDWDVAQHVAQTVKRDPENAHDIARGKPSVEQIDASRRATSRAFYETLIVQLKDFEKALAALDDELERKAGDSAPSFRQTREAFETVYRLAERFARDVGVDPDAVLKQPETSRTAPESLIGAPPTDERSEPSFKTPLAPHLSDEGFVQTPTRVPSRAHGGIQSRADAVAQLRAVADYFRATEPHSPVAYLADKAAEWAGMPLHEWLATVVKDDGTLSHIREMLGVKSEN
ncbi:type VI secretion system protein ImpA [Paraburkholderia bannensis]|uniref:Type VI secretion system protein ImpA n=1 Tax=Paraburkholderia bannensis TaxID=765414 RepID=A0A7W9WSP8_9BURK|nr:MULTISPECIES: type VI secretion system protein TssA [Paraburkholderia]MBB3257721.1 type VI secretion system protein ImpA [Paraburkholderia sp. WP4_3_2]MBB6102734.1 type VI secretion system protein ImpA [Paraburkholderia bannensis]